MDKVIHDTGRSEYDSMVGRERDDEGFIILRPTASYTDNRIQSLTTDIGTLEDKLKALRTEKASAVAYQKTDEYKESKKKQKSKKKKKEKARLISMIFNNADNASDKDDEDEKPAESSGDTKPSKKKGKAKEIETTLDTTYGLRFSPLMEMLHDMSEDFARIAADLEKELNSPACRAKTMYRSTQTGNMLTAKNSQFNVIKEMDTIAKQISDLEYREKKDRRAEEGSDTTKAIANLSAKYLRGVDLKDGKKDKKTVGGKQKDKDKDTKSSKEKEKKAREAKRREEPDDDEDEDDSFVKSPSDRADHNSRIARDFAKMLERRADEIKLTPYERHLEMEGKYKFVVACDPLDPEHTWDFLVVDPETDKEIKGFKKEYKDLLPKKKSCRLRFDIAKKKCTDLNSSKTYKLVFTN